ncbi:hypothetical protein [Clavibacter sp. VKM Ac-2872]|uniref:hypothetical protein n=1 Tax=Clavibacter sp. VKM Ac-2872 TaxID=2783812 RepID=UPI00188AF88B|nr:hypothetical protein [Clavibacter sp. VKM Ac-2872]MBF4625560.1 hypothetical protein [Clavibacter sp. VKM Ac-2872]
MDTCPECGHEAGVGEPSLGQMVLKVFGVRKPGRHPECPWFHVDYAVDRCFCRNAFHPHPQA